MQTNINIACAKFATETYPHDSAFIYNQLQTDDHLLIAKPGKASTSNCWNFAFGAMLS